MAVVWTDVRDMPGGAFASYTETQIDAALARAGRRIDATFWGDLADDATLYLTLHLLAVEDPTNAAAGGSLKRMKAGPLEKEYQAVAWSAQWYNATSYGREYRALLQSMRWKATPRAI